MRVVIMGYVKTLLVYMNVSVYILIVKSKIDGPILVRRHRHVFFLTNLAAIFKMFPRCVNIF